MWAKLRVRQSFTATSRRNESDRRLAACTSVCALQFYTESTLGTSSESLVERSYGHSPLVFDDVEHDRVTDLECSYQPHIQGRGAKKRTQRAG